MKTIILTVQEILSQQLMAVQGLIEDLKSFSQHFKEISLNKLMTNNMAKNGQIEI